MIDTKIREGLVSLKNKGKPVIAKNKITGDRFKLGIIEDEVRLFDGDNLHVIQKIALIEPKAGEKFAYRCGYYTYDKNEIKRYWGQAPSLLISRDFTKLYSEAKQKGWFG